MKCQGLIFWWWVYVACQQYYSLSVSHTWIRPSVSSQTQRKTGSGVAPALCWSRIKNRLCQEQGVAKRWPSVHRPTRFSCNELWGLLSQEYFVGSDFLVWKVDWIFQERCMWSDVTRCTERAGSSQNKHESRYKQRKDERVRSHISFMLHTQLSNRSLRFWDFKDLSEEFVCFSDDKTLNERLQRSYDTDGPTLCQDESPSRQ